MEMKMNAGEKPQYEKKNNLHTPDFVMNRADVLGAYEKNDKNVLVPVARAFVTQYPDTEQGLRVFCCTRCRFANLSITPFVSNCLDTMSLEYRCTERSNEFIGQVFVWSDGTARILNDCTIPEICGILHMFEQKIESSINSINAREDIKKAAKALFGGENKRFALSDRQLVEHLKSLIAIAKETKDCRELLSFQFDFQEFISRVEKGEILCTESLELQYEPARSHEIMDAAYENIQALAGAGCEELIKEFLITKGIVTRLYYMHDVIRQWVKPYWDWQMTTEWSRKKEPPYLNEWTLVKEEKDYVYTPPELDEDERAAGLVRFDELCPGIIQKPVFNGRW